MIRLDLFYRKSVIGRAYENRNIDTGFAMWAFYLSVVFDMRVVFIMFMIKRLKGDVPVSAYAEGKLARCIACDEYVNEQNKEY